MNRSDDRSDDGPREGAEPGVAMTISAVERDLGLSKDTLRIWERRYGFPAPLRDAGGERLYPAEQVARLRVIQRLLDAGHRPGRIVGLDDAALAELAGQGRAVPARTLGGRAAAAPVPAADDVQPLLERIIANDVPALRLALTRRLAGLGPQRFVSELLGPLNLAVGDAWLRGHLEVYQEHLYTEVAQTVLRQALATLALAAEPGARPRVLLATPTGESHGLGLLMAEAVLWMEGCTCLSLGPQAPLWDLVRGAGALQADIVALGFGGSLSPSVVNSGLLELRAKLGHDVALWAGGTAPVLQRRRIPGVQIFETLAAVPEAVRQWREGQSSPPARRMGTASVPLS